MAREDPAALQWIAGLPEDRRTALTAIRATVLDSLHEGYEERQVGTLLNYVVPHELYPPGYHCNPKTPLPYIALGSTKGHIALYLFALYCSPELQAWFREAWTATGHRLDMGKSCVRVKKLEALPLEVLAEFLRRTPPKRAIADYEAGRDAPSPAATPKTKVTKKTAKKAAAKRSTKKKASKKTTRSSSPETN